MLLYQALIVVLLVLLLANAVANLWALGRLRAVPAPEEGPSVSILIPARNEESTIQDSLWSLLNQEYPNFEVIVLDDDSDDQTAELTEDIVRKATDRGINARIIRGQDVPVGWTGKNWACYQLAEASTGDYLFFTDAHTIHEPGTVAALVDYSTQKTAGLLTGWPRLTSGNVVSEMITAIIPFTVLSLFPIWFQRLTQFRRKPQDRGVNRLVTVANADYLFFTRDCYTKIGGHAAVAGQVLDGLALAREVTVRADEGLRFFHCDAGKFAKVQWNGSTTEVREHLARLTEAAIHQRKPAFWGAIAALVAVYLLPFVNAFLVPSHTLHTVLQQITLIYLIHVAMVLRLGTSVRGALLHPAGMVLTLWLVVTARFTAQNASVQWKGRSYGVIPTPAVEPEPVAVEEAAEEETQEEEVVGEQRQSFKHLLP